MSDDKIIPFGKYKGRTVQEVQGIDPQYLEWLSQQQWFVDKFKPVYNVVIQNFHQEPEETPAHNAMQVRFLEDAYCMKFVQNIGGMTVAAMIDRHNKELEEYAISSYCSTYQSEEKKNQIRIYGYDRDRESKQSALRSLKSSRESLRKPYSYYQDPVTRKGIKDSIREQQLFLVHWRKERTLYRRAAASEKAVTYLFRRVFEQGVDVWLSVQVKSVVLADAYEFSCKWHGDFAIELKPSVGDDYPAVLRQIHAQQQRGKAAATWVLLAGQYSGVGASWDEVKKMFSQSDIVASLENELAVVIT